MTLVISLVAPVFLGITNGDLNLARVAAIEAINDFRAKNSVSLIAAAQILTLGLAAIGSLSLSMDDKTSVPLALRLRASANACNRSAEQNRRALQAAQMQEKAREAEENEAFQDAIFADPDPDPDPGPTSEPEVFLTPQAESLLAAEAEARLQNNPVGQTAAQPQTAPKTPTKPTAPTGNQQAWAIAMQREAGKINAAIPHLPPAQRQAASLRAAALSTTAHSILGAAALPKNGAHSA
jgi:hypothetical protein